MKPTRLVPRVHDNGDYEMIEAWDGPFIRYAEHEKIVGRMMEWVAVEDRKPTEKAMVIQWIEFSDGDVVVEVGDVLHSKATHWMEVRGPRA